MAWISSFPLMPADSSWFTLAEDQPGRIQSTASLLGVGLSQSQPLVCSLQLLPLRAQLPGMSTELYQGTGLLCSEVDKVHGSDLLPGAGSTSMSRLLVERRIPIYQLCHAGLKGGHPWLTLLQSSGTWRVRISAFTSKVPWLPQNSPTLPDSEFTDWRRDLLRRVRGMWATQNRTIWGDLDVPGNVSQPQQPSAPATHSVWPYTSCAAIQGLLCSRKVQPTVTSILSLFTPFITHQNSTKTKPKAIGQKI